jgi:hypothetical protein
MGIKVVPFIGLMDVMEVIHFIKSKPMSILALHERNDAPMEGVVCRSVPLVLFRNTKTPVMWKLKVKDYEVKAKKPKEEKKE